LDESAETVKGIAFAGENVSGYLARFPGFGIVIGAKSRKNNGISEQGNDDPSYDDKKSPALHGRFLLRPLVSPSL
jgi:hypothetical protein